MRVLVTGATGFIGGRLVRRLLGAGHEILALSRDSERAAAVLPARCRVDGWQPGERQSLAHLGALDAVVHLAGEGIADARWSEQRKRSLYRSRVDTTRALVAAIAALPSEHRPKVFLCASAIGYYGDRGDEPLDEASTAGTGFLAGLCRDWEREALAAGAHGVRAAAVRIGVVLGRGGGALARMLPPFRLGIGGRIGSGRQWTSWIHLDDLADLLCLVIESPRARGVINAVAPRPVTNAELTAALGRVLGRPALFPVPAFLLRMVFGEMAEVLLSSQKVLPAAAERLGFAFRFSDIDAALAEICADLGHEIEREQWLRRERAEIFRFFADPRNLERVTPPDLKLRVVRVSSKELGEGTLIDYSLRLYGLPARWQSRIEEWKPVERFVDTQRRGPYALWRHVHEFEPHEGGTIVRDRVRYRLPFGALGDLVAGGRVGRELRRIFDHRRVQLMSLFADGPAQPGWDEV